MPYVYQAERPRLFTENGVRILNETAANAHALITKAGAATAGKLYASSGDTWLFHAAIDYLVERGYLQHINQGSVCGQDEIYTLTHPGAVFRG
jgi:hypothetical protein